MALVFPGKSLCPICGCVIRDDQRLVSFPPFIGNELDPLFFFHDSAFHEECFERHPLRDLARQQVEELRRNATPANRRCIVCMQAIEDPDDYFTLGHLVSDRRDPLFVYNYAQFHLSCVPRWQERVRVQRLLADLERSGKWKGKALRWVLDHLRDRESA